MAWWILIPCGFAFLIIVFASGVPMFVGFLLANIGGLLLLVGSKGFPLIVNSIFDTLTGTVLAAVPLFILMGEILFRSGSVNRLLDSVDTLIRGIHGRLYIVTLVLSVIFGALSGSTMGVSAMMARLLYPEMMRRGYDSRLTIGAILSGASLAPIIPPSIAIVITAMLTNVSVAKLLIAGILPGILLAAMFIAYIALRLVLTPSVAPRKGDELLNPISLRDVAKAIAGILPFSIIIFCVIGTILLGIATPTEAAAAGVFGATLLSVAQGTFKPSVLSESVASTLQVSGVILVLMASSIMFGQLLAFTGAARQLATFAVSFELSPYLIFLVMMLVAFVLCSFIDQTAVLLILAPVFLPILSSLPFDPIWLS